jgi:hypothetical protein
MGVDALLFSSGARLQPATLAISKERDKDGFRRVFRKIDRAFFAKKRSGWHCSVLDGWRLVVTGKGHCSSQLPFVHVDMCRSDESGGLHVSEDRVNQKNRSLDLRSWHGLFRGIPRDELLFILSLADAQVRVVDVCVPPAAYRLS